MLYNLIFIMFFCSCDKKANYKFIGEFEYEITNQTDFENTYLYDSYGYVVGDKIIPGIKINESNKLLDNSKNYVIVYNHPAKTILIDSKNIRGEGIKSIEKPIEVIVDKSNKKTKLFIYELDNSYSYRLLRP